MEYHRSCRDGCSIYFSSPCAAENTPSSHRSLQLKFASIQLAHYLALRDDPRRESDIDTSFDVNSTLGSARPRRTQSSPTPQEKKSLHTPTSPELPRPKKSVKTANAQHAPRRESHTPGESSVHSHTNYCTLISRRTCPICVLRFRCIACSLAWRVVAASTFFFPRPSACSAAFGGFWNVACAKRGSGLGKLRRWERVWDAGRLGVRTVGRGAAWD